MFSTRIPVPRWRNAGVPRIVGDPCPDDVLWNAVSKINLLCGNETSRSCRYYRTLPQNREVIFVSCFHQLGSFFHPPDPGQVDRWGDAGTVSINPDPNQGSGQDNKEGSEHGSRVLRNVVKTRQKQEIGSVIRGKSFYSDYWFFMSLLQHRPLPHLAFWISYLMKEVLRFQKQPRF